MTLTIQRVGQKKDAGLRKLQLNIKYTEWTTGSTHPHQHWQDHSGKRQLQIKEDVTHHIDCHLCSSTD